MRACRSVDQLKRPWRLRRKTPDNGPDSPSQAAEQLYGVPSFVPGLHGKHAVAGSPSRECTRKAPGTRKVKQSKRGGAQSAWRSTSSEDEDRPVFSMTELTGGDSLEVADARSEESLWLMQRNVEQSCDLARRADRRAQVLESFVRHQCEWLASCADEMRQVGVLISKGPSEARRHWDEFTSGVVRQSERALGLLGAQEDSKGRDTLDATGQLESLLIDYERENFRLLEDLGRGTAIEREGVLEGVIQRAELKCLCANGCRCWSVARPGQLSRVHGGDPVETLCKGWLKDDDIRLHKRIIEEQRVIVERHEKLCTQQRVELKGWPHRLAECREKLQVSESECHDMLHEKTEWKAERGRLQAMISGFMERSSEMKKEVQTLKAESAFAGREVTGLSEALESAQSRVQLFETVQEKLNEKGNLNRAAKVLQRSYRKHSDWNKQKRVHAAEKLQHLFRRWYTSKCNSALDACVAALGDTGVNQTPSLMDFDWNNEDEEVAADHVAFLDTLVRIEEWDAGTDQGVDKASLEVDAELAEAQMQMAKMEFVSERVYAESVEDEIAVVRKELQAENVSAKAALGEAECYHDALQTSLLSSAEIVAEARQVGLAATEADVLQMWLLSQGEAMAHARDAGLSEAAAASRCLREGDGMGSCSTTSPDLTVLNLRMELEAEAQAAQAQHEADAARISLLEAELSSVHQ